MASHKGLFIHEKAICETQKIGDQTRIWAFSHILPNATIGSDCNICDHVFIENDVIIGDRVTIKCGVQVWDGARIGNDVFIGPNVTFTNDPFPRSKVYPKTYGTVCIHDHASIGGNAVLLPNIVIGQYAMIGAGAVVTKNVPAHAVVAGNPARIISYCTTPSAISHLRTEGAIKETTVEATGCKVFSFDHHDDMRGELSVFSLTSTFPFFPKRVFTVFHVPTGKIRGEHAHKKCSQVLIASHGTLNVVVDNGTNRAEIKLEKPTRGLYIPPGVWGTQYNFSSDAVLTVFASDDYDPGDYIRDYNQFLDFIHSLH